MGFNSGFKGLKEFLKVFHVYQLINSRIVPENRNRVWDSKIFPLNFQRIFHEYVVMVGISVTLCLTVNKSDKATSTND